MRVYIYIYVCNSISVPLCFCFHGLDRCFFLPLYFDKDSKMVNNSSATMISNICVRRVLTSFPYRRVWLTFALMLRATIFKRTRIKKSAYT